MWMRCGGTCKVGTVTDAYWTKCERQSVFHRLSESHLSKNGRVRPCLYVERRLSSVLEREKFSRLNPHCASHGSCTAWNREPRLFLCAHDLKENLDILVEIRAVLLNETKIREIKDERLGGRDFTQGFEQGVHILDEDSRSIPPRCRWCEHDDQGGFRNKSIFRSDVTKICTDICHTLSERFNPFPRPWFLRFDLQTCRARVFSSNGRRYARESNLLQQQQLRNCGSFLVKLQ